MEWELCAKSGKAQLDLASDMRITVEWILLRGNRLLAF